MARLQMTLVVEDGHAKKKNAIPRKICYGARIIDATACRSVSIYLLHFFEAKHESCTS